MNGQQRTLEVASDHGQWCTFGFSLRLAEGRAGALESEQRIKVRQTEAQSNHSSAFTSVKLTQVTSIP